jgi:hypothetical protein
MVANWLYGVAYRTALKARATAARRKVRERQVTDMPEPEAARPDVWHDLRPLLDEELSRLPDKYRVPVVLCDLEGRSRKEAARHLGWPEGTVAGRLARARGALAEALARRGVVLSVGALAVALAQNAAAAPAALVGPTVKAARLAAAGQAAAGAVSARVAALTEGVLRTMVLSKQKTVLAVFLVALLGLGGGALGWQTRAAENGPPSQQSGREGPGKKQEDNLKNTLLALDRHLWEALSKGEWREIQKFYAPDYLGVSVAGKSGHAANVEAAKHLRVTDWKVRDADVVRVSKDAAVLTYIYSCKVVTPEGRLIRTNQDLRATQVWAQRDGGWVLVFCHTEYARQPGPTAGGPKVTFTAEVEVFRRMEKGKAKPGPGPGK